VRIAVSLLSLRPGRVGGAETYVRALLRHLPAVAGGDELVAVMGREVAAALETPGFRRVVHPAGDLGLVAERVLEAYTPWRAKALERLFASLETDVLFFPQQSIFPARVAGPAVLTVGDVQHLFFPDNFGLFDRTFRARVYPRSMERAEHLIAVSEFTRRTLLERCGVRPGKITVVNHGIDLLSDAERETIRPTELVQGPYLYYPAATYAHKDHESLLRSYAALRRQGVLSARLVFTGEQTALWRSRLAKLVAELGVEGDVVHLGFVPYAEVRRLLTGAEAVVFPTRFEGFGLPVVEAAQFRRRIVTSRLEVFDEIGVPKRFQIDFADPGQLRAALETEGVTALEKQPSSWRETAQRTIDVIRNAALRSASMRAGSPTP